jgi:hypothetical protein
MTSLATFSPPAVGYRKEVIKLMDLWVVLLLLGIAFCTGYLFAWRKVTRLYDKRLMAKDNMIRSLRGKHPPRRKKLFGLF